MPSEISRRTALPALLIGLLAPVVGCDSGPKTGTVASPVDPVQAAQQNKAIEDYAKEMAKNKGRGGRK